MARRDRWLRRLVLTVILVAGATASIATSRDRPALRWEGDWQSERLTVIDPVLERRARFCLGNMSSPVLARLTVSVELVGASGQGLLVPVALATDVADTSTALNDGRPSARLTVSSVPVSPATGCTDWATLTVKRPVTGSFGGSGEPPRGFVSWRFEIQNETSSLSDWEIQVPVDGAPAIPTQRSGAS